MTCNDARDMLALYSGGELESNERIAADAHLAVCAACAGELDRYREVRANLAVLREEELPSAVWSGIWNDVRREVFPRSVSPVRRLLVNPLSRLAAVLLVGLVSGGVLHLAVRNSAYAPLVYPPASEPRVTSEASRGNDWIFRSSAGNASEQALFGSPAAQFQLPRITPYVPRAKMEGSYYLPLVESIPGVVEKDF